MSLYAWIYYIRMRGTYLWRADVQYNDISLYSLKLEISGGECTAVSMIDDKQFEEICALLEDAAAKERLLRIVFSKFVTYLRSDTTIHLDNSADVTEIIAPGPAMKEWIQFQKAKRSQFWMRDNYIASVVLESGAILGGIQLIWTDNDRVEIQLPSVQEMRRAREFAKDSEKWDAICRKVRQLYRNRTERSAMQTQLPSAAAGSAVRKPEASLPDVREACQGARNGDAGSEGQENRSGTIGTADSQTDNCEEAIDQPVRPAAETVREARINGKPLNRYGRVRDSEDTGMLKYIPGNVLRPAEMIKKMKEGESYRPKNPDYAGCLRRLSNGTINIQHIEILACISNFRFITSALLVDLYSGGYIPHDTRTESFGQDHINKRLKNLSEWDLVTPCQFISADESGGLNFERKSNGYVYVISRLGSKLLQELGREAAVHTFDVYQDGRTVRERLCLNQWVIYWMAAYPEVVGSNYGFNQVLYRLDHEMSGARVLAWVCVKDRILFGQHVRRCDESAQMAFDQEMIGKLERIQKLFEDPEKLYRLEGEGYFPEHLSGRPILNYICEDQDHMHSTMEKLKHVIQDGQEVWFTWDQGLFNYCYEGERFWRFDSKGVATKIDPATFFDIGEERKEEKRLDAEEQGRT